MSCKEDGMCKTAAICFLAGCQDEASPVQGAASASEDNKYDCPGDVRFVATSSASGAKGALLAEIQAALDSLADTKMTTHTYTSMANVLHHCRDAITGRGYYGEAALADRSPAVQPVAGQASFDKWFDSIPEKEQMRSILTGHREVSRRAWMASRATPAPEQEAAPQLATNLRAALAAADAEKHDECSWQEFSRVFDRGLVEQEAAPQPKGESDAS